MKTPIRHGDWRVINGETVDVSHAPQAASAPKADVGRATPADPPAPKARRRRKSKSEG